ncbi:phage tail protein [Sphingomonas morindae]|uniref:Phage tail protein n=1 Tax=Sphingomonas morindae TaxID=1541170 RepID=A0ABY4X762_9SPHN|nr:phage tail protein [Sphingomonas morindae]USI72716.1 phage tail protein [Sphingomonas morindae]
MKKPESLRRLLAAAVPYLTANPDRLAVFVDGGQIAGGGGADLTFEYRYTLTAVIEEYDGDPDLLMVPVLAWLAEQQPELLEKAEARPFRFTMELLDGEASDIEIKIEGMAEGVIVTPRAGGGYGVAAVPERPGHGFDRFPDVPCGARLWQLLMGADMVARTSDPAFRP